ncbi:DUF4224 domain-containing protein [Pseudomonas sp.]|uniref:DUF4224 domain-containing protein n=1 Tax=Pseudomonas sp. TaxID=306 RepID=UPI0025864010|nr:DUF4224 domain-containing protein [Pseudomonas sp.]
MTAFLDDNEIRLLTGRCQKAKQIDQLKRMGLPFYINAAGRPVVARSAIDTTRRLEVSSTQPSIWRPKILGT